MKPTSSISRPTAQRRSSAVAVWAVAVLAVFVVSIFLPSATAANQKPVQTYSLDGNIFSIDISSDGHYYTVCTVENAGSYNINRVYLFSKEQTIPMWSYTLPEKRSIYKTHISLSKVVMSANGEYIVAAGDTGAFLFHRDSSTPVWSNAPNNRTGFWDIAISDNGNYIVAGGGGYYFYLFSKESSIPLWNFSSGDTSGDGIMSVDISSDGNYVTAGTRNGYVYLFDKSSNVPLWNYNVSNDGSSRDLQLSEVALSSNGEYLTVGSTYQYGPIYYEKGEYYFSANQLYLFSTMNNTPLWNYTLPDSVFDVEISNNGQFITTYTSRSISDPPNHEIIELYLFDKSNVMPIKTFDLGTYSYIGNVFIASSGDGKYTIIFHSDRTSLIYHNAAEPLWTTDKAIGEIAISYDGSDIIVGSGDTLYLFDNVPNARDEQQSTFSRINVFLLLLILGIVVSIGGGAWMWKRRSMTPIGVSPPPSSPTPPSSFPPLRTPSTTGMAPMPISMPAVSEPLPETTTVTIECPSCKAQMKIPKLDRLQQVRCEACGTEGDVEI